MKNIIRNLLIVIYAVIAIFTTVCLISYNDQRVTVFGETSLVIIDNRDLEPQYTKGELAIVDGSYKAEVGDTIFFYNTYSNEMDISVAKITDMEKITDKEYTYTLEGDKALSSEYVIGTTAHTTAIPVLGTILGVLESKWGFLFGVVLPTLLFFLYELVEVFKELKGYNETKKEESENKEENKEEQQ